MRRPAVPAAALAVVAWFCIAGAGGRPAGAAAVPPAFQRGATLVEFFQFPAIVGEGASKAYANPAFPRALANLNLFDFDALRRTGFDHMRVPLDVGPLLEAGEAERQAIVDQLVAVIATINRHGLAVLVTLFPPSLHHELPEAQLDGFDGGKFRAYAAAVDRIGGALGGLDPDMVALEPMNEPQSECVIHFGTDWSSYQQALVERIRRVAPDLPVFLTGGCWSDIDGIVLLDSALLRDRRNFVSVHFYHPFVFTHQGAWWTVPFAKGTIGVPYPAAAGNLDETLALTHARFKTLLPEPDFDPAAAERKADYEIRRYFREGQGAAQIAERMNRLAAWQQQQQIASDHIVFTEFGAVKETIGGVQFDPASRARWLHDASAAIAGRGWGWTAFVLRDDPFGLYVHEGDRYPDPRILKALGLGPPPDALAPRRVDNR